MNAPVQIVGLCKSLCCGLGKLDISAVAGLTPPPWETFLRVPPHVPHFHDFCLHLHEHVASIHTECGNRSMHQLDCHTVLQMLAEKVRLARKEVKAAQNLILQAELKARRRVLRRLGYVDSDGVVTVKGRAAAEIQSADELVLTELMFSGVFKVNVAKSACAC